MAATASLPRRLLEEQLAGGHHPSRGVDAERAVQFPVATEEREELGIGDRAGHHLHLVVGGRPPEELDAMIELVTPEERQRFVGLEGFTGGEVSEVGGHVSTLLGGVGPVLDPHLLVEQPVRPSRDVAGGEHPGNDLAGHVERIEVRIAHHAVA